MDNEIETANDLVFKLERQALQQLVDNMTEQTSEGSYKFAAALQAMDVILRRYGLGITTENAAS